MPKPKPCPWRASCEYLPSPHSFPADVPVTPVLDGHSCAWCPVLSVAQPCHHPRSFPLHNLSQSPFPPVHRHMLQECSGGRTPLRICGQVFHFCIPVMRRQNLRLPSSPRASLLFTQQLRASQARAEQAVLPGSDQDVPPRVVAPASPRRTFMGATEYQMPSSSEV